jgi:hypothetical protein
MAVGTIQDNLEENQKTLLLLQANYPKAIGFLLQQSSYL